MRTSSTPSRIVCVLILTLLGTVAGCDTKPPFSQEEYDKGFLLAFKLNAEFGRAQLCYIEEAWSQGRGFDDGLKAFNTIYPKPNFDPTSYLAHEHIHQIIKAVQTDTTVLTKTQKIEVLKLLDHIHNNSSLMDSAE